MVCSTFVLQGDAAMNSTVTIRLNDEEREIFEKYAKVYKGGVSTMIKQLALEKLQDEYDLAIVSEYEKKRAEGKIKLRPYEDFLKEIESE